MSTAKYKKLVNEVYDLQMRLENMGVPHVEHSCKLLSQMSEQYLKIHLDYLRLTLVIHHLERL